MAYQLGYAGGYTDEVAAPPPSPVVGGGTPLYRRRWTTRPAPPPMPQPPVRVRARIRVTCRWTAKVVRITPPIRVVAPALGLGLRVRAVTVRVAEHKVVARMEVKNVALVLAMDPVALSRHAWEQRELTEIAVALAALE